jgi:hypothetical protein
MMNVIASAVMILGLPLAGWGLRIAQIWVDAHIQNAAAQRWASGALSAAGRAYTELVRLRQQQPTAKLEDLVPLVVTDFGTQFFKGYADTADLLGGTVNDARQRVAGALGEMLAKDPSVSIAQPAVGTR